jgi:hypothetical protein
MMGDVEEQEEQRRQELLKLYFEFFKHLTTLGVAAAVVLLALYREGIAERELVAFSLMMFGLASFIAVCGMLMTVARFRAGKAGGRAFSMLLSLVFVLFSYGLLVFIVQATNTPTWVLYVVAGALVLVLGFVLYRQRISER